ncbi:MAG: hypothetical protein C0397_05750 [Odoribacter sp.]|nr:hypothetical protein [Odoribacter sp.]
MKTKIINFIVLIVLITSCGTKAKKENSTHSLMLVNYHNLTTDLTQITSGYILSSESSKIGPWNDSNTKTTIIRLPEVIDFDLISISINRYIANQKDWGLHVVIPWTKNKELSDPTYYIGLSGSKSTNELFVIYYIEKYNNKELRIIYSFK